MNPYRHIFIALERAKIKYLVVGGVAVNLYGYPRFTGDIDILMALDKKNLEKMSSVMKRLGYIERLPVKLFELEDRVKVKKWFKEKGMTAYTFICAKQPQLNLDILVSLSLDFQKFFKKRVLLSTLGIKIPVVAIGDLIKMKRKAGRQKDLEDLAVLLELKTL